ncbi:patatin-like phospholipase family protein [Candidiatus Paracoxiella cheracis]|uniref:patatin-like phospholipase family protein n=1 Tax=Candidiatus Paracoxiella cheracis TaxID=3405120 RepID=UPI003BF4EE9E
MSKLRATIVLMLSLLITSCAGIKPDITIPQTPPPPVKLKIKPQVVIVLGSGGARGYAHLGVLQALYQAGIPINAIVCASAGCIVGALYADNNNPKTTYDIMMHASFWDFADVSNILSPSGLIEGYHLEKFLLRNMRAKTFRQLKTKLIVATTNLKTGTTYPIESGPVAPAILASAALPGAVQPVHLYGHVLIDGGVANPIPVDLAKKLHPTIIIAINIAEQLPQHVPINAVSIYSRAYAIMWKKLTEYSEKNATIVIHPKLGEVGTFDLGKKYPMYLAGYHAAEKVIPKIKRLLAEKNIPLKNKNRVSSKKDDTRSKNF